MMLLVVLFTVVSASAGTVDESQVTFLTAIRSTGDQAFNTGYTHKANTRVEMDCEVTKNSQRDWEALFGGRLSDFTKNAFCFFTRHRKNSSTAKDEPCFNRTGVETTGSNFVYGERIKLVCEGKTAKWYKYSNLNTVVGSVTTTGTANEGKTPMFLFNLNTASTEGGTKEDTSPSVMTLYGCKIYEGETLKCNFVPAKYNNVVGLYDCVNKTFSGSITSTAFQAVDDYDRALIAIHDGQSYRIFTVVNGQKYYVTADGKLSTALADAPLFIFTKIKGEEYEYGFQLKNGDTYFTNPKTENETALTLGQLNTMNSTPRNTWEAQVFFLNSNGKYAIRSTNAKSGTSGWEWVGRAFWTLNEGPKAEYSWDINYVWQLESEMDLLGQELLTNGQCDGTYNGWAKTDLGSGWGIANENGTYCWVSSYYECTLSQTVTLSKFSISETDIDNGKVTCAASAEMKAPLRDETKPQGAKVNKVYVEMIDASNNVLGTITLIDDKKIYQDWTPFRSEGFQLVSGTRQLKYVVRGQDACFWVGQYGPCYRNLSLKARVEGGSTLVEYPVWLGGKQVTSENKDDVLGDGTVSYEPGDGTGTLTITTATPNITGFSLYGMIHANGIGLTINAPHGLHLDEKNYYYGLSVYNGSLTFNGNLSGSMKNFEMYVSGGDLKVIGNIDFSTSNSWGIYVSGNVDIEGNVALRASNHCIEAHSLKVKGNLSVSNQSEYFYPIELHDGDLTVEGNVTGSAVKRVIGTWGNVYITGDLNLTTSGKYSSPISINYEKDVVIKGNVAIKMENNGSQGIYAGNITIDGDVKVWGGYYALCADNNLTIVSGSWELDAIDRVLSCSELTIPDTHEIIVPAGGTVSQYGHILDADGNYVKHAFIGEKGDTPPPTTYAITVKGGKAYEDIFSSSQVYFAEPGRPVTVVPDLAVGQYVQYWESDVDVEFLSNGSSADFIMPESNVTLTPVYANQQSYGIDVRNGNEMTLDEEVYLALLDTYKSKNNTIISLASNDFDLDGDGNDDIQITKVGGEGCKARALDGTKLTGVFSVTRANSSKYYPINVAFSGAVLPTWDGIGTEAHPYIISSAEELDQLAQCVKGSDDNQPNSFTYKYFKLGADITYNHETAWDDITSTEDNYTPIGFIEGDSEYVFDGQFDGDGHTVSGIRIYKGDRFACLGLFGNIGFNAVVKNVILDDARITGCNEFGGIAGRNLYRVSNCHVTANVTIHTGWENARNVGGIVGTNGSISYGASVAECSCAATLSLVDGIQENTGYGGIVGMSYRGYIWGNIVAGATIPTTTYDLSNGYTHGAIIGHLYVDGNTFLENNYYRNCTVEGTANATNCGIGNFNDGVAADYEDDDAAVPQRKGDVDLDGAATNKDVTAAVGQLIGVTRNRLTEVAADLNNNNKVDIEDVTAIIRSILEK